MGLHDYRYNTIARTDKNFLFIKQDSKKQQQKQQQQQQTNTQAEMRFGM